VADIGKIGGGKMRVSSVVAAVRARTGARRANALRDRFVLGVRARETGVSRQPLRRFELQLPGGR
jgi:hypothetical protein